MKIGTVAWNWLTDVTMTPSDNLLYGILDQAAPLGVDFIDMISTPASIDAYYTPAEVKKLRGAVDAKGLFVGALVFSSSDWNNPDATVRDRLLESLARACDVAGTLGAGSVNTISCLPYGAKPTRGNASPSEKQTFNLPADYDYRRDWATYMDCLRRAAGIARAHGLRFSIECFPGTLCATPDAWLRAIAEVDQPAFGIQLDTAHLGNQRIDIETAIYMVGGKNIVHVHCKDTDRITRGNLPAGCGVVDYTAVIRALRACGYEGMLSIEVEFTDNPPRYIAQALAHLRMCDAGTY